MRKWMTTAWTSCLLVAAAAPAALASIDGEKDEAKAKPAGATEERVERIEEAWEAWAERYAKRWEEWGTQFEKRMEGVAERDAKAWEEWAENYARVWEEFAHGVEAGRSPIDLDAVIAASLRELKKMPLDNLEAALTEQLGQLGQTGDLEGLGELIEMTVESTLAGLEGVASEDDVSGDVRGSIGEILKMTEQYRSALDHRRRAMDGEAGEQWRELRAALRGIEGWREFAEQTRQQGGSDDQPDAADPSDENDELRELRRPRQGAPYEALRARIESLKRLQDDDVRAALVERLARERAALSDRDAELDALRAEVERLRHEVERLKENRQDERGVRF